MDNYKKNFVVAALRRASYRWHGRYKALKDGRAGRNSYLCAHCPEGIAHPKKNVQLDHKIPIVPVAGWDGFDGLIDRLFCEDSGYQILCKEHHKLKTAEENLIRKETVKKKKLDKA